MPGDLVTLLLKSSKKPTPSGQPLFGGPKKEKSGKLSGSVLYGESISGSLSLSGTSFEPGYLGLPTTKQ